MVKYTPESSALPTGKLEGLHATTDNMGFNREFAALQLKWQAQFCAWLGAHDKRILAEHGVTEGGAE